MARAGACAVRARMSPARPTMKRPDRSPAACGRARAASGISAGRGARLGGSTGCTAAFATGREGAMSAYRTAAADGRSTRVPRGTRPSAHGTRYSGY
ncbi:hypothetical protein SUDANB120_05757 [Streptomyces sp. enrichment culture]